jgi:transposase
VFLRGTGPSAGASDRSRTSRTRFAYSPNRKGEHPQQHLDKFEGILQAGAFAGFNKLYERGTIQQAPCMAHIRRNFFDLMKAHNSHIATEAVQRIAALYLIERQIRGRPAEERRAMRIAKAKPLFDDMGRWLGEALVSVRSFPLVSSQV